MIVIFLNCGIDTSLSKCKKQLHFIELVFAKDCSMHFVCIIIFLILMIICILDATEITSLQTRKLAKEGKKLLIAEAVLEVRPYYSTELTLLYHSPIYSEVYRWHT